MSKIIKEINPDIVVKGNITEPRTGSFEVKVDGHTVFSKLKNKKFPTIKEIESWL